MLVTEITFSQWRLHFCQYVYILSVILHHGSQVLLLLVCVSPTVVKFSVQISWTLIFYFV